MICFAPQLWSFRYSWSSTAAATEISDKIVEAFLITFQTFRDPKQKQNKPERFSPETWLGKSVKAPLLY